MTPEQFRAWSVLINDPILLVQTDGLVLAANGAVHQLGLTAASLEGHPLSALTTLSENELPDWLRPFARTTSPVVASLTFVVNGTTVRCRCDGVRAGRSLEQQTSVLLKCIRHEASVTSYKLLNKTVERLNEEIRLRMKLESDLRRHNDFLQVTLRSIGDGVIVTDDAGTITMMNPVAEDLTGWSSQDATGRPLDGVFRIVNESTLEPAENPALRALRDGSIVGLANHTVLIARNGSACPIDDSAAPIADARGKLVGAVLVFRNVAEKRKWDRELLDQKRLLEAVTSNASSLLFLMDANDRITYVNSAVEKITGYAASELLGRTLPETLGNFPAGGTLSRPEECPVEAARQTGLPIRDVELHFLKKDGSAFPVRCSSSPLPGNAELSGVVLEAQDITRERENIIALEQSEARFKQLADAIPQLVWMARPDGYIDWYNNRWCEYTGVRAEESEGWNWQQFHHPDHLPAVMEEWKDALEKGRIFSMVFPLRGADGMYRSFLTKVIPVCDADGKVVRWFGTNTDISDQKQLEEELRLAAQQLMEADRRKDEFLATLAHELRNPLAPIRTGLELLEMLRDDPEESDRIRTMMDRQTQQLITLVDDLMEVSRITRGKLELRMSDVALSEVVQCALESAQPMIAQKNHTLSVHQPADDVIIHADPNRLAQILSNLLNNAAKFTSPQGNITVSVETSDRDLLISVKDSGIGIPLELQETIFEMFTQVATNSRHGSSGLGIGLTLVRSLVEQHGGTIRVSSRGANAGSEFRVCLPVVVSSSRTPVVESADVQSAMTERKRVLVVDDNEAALDALNQLVQALGHDSRMAIDGLDAIEVADAFRPEIVLMDVGMPRMDGLEAARVIRSREWGKPITLVALTGWGQDDDLRRTREAGFDMHIVKPASLDDLRRILTMAPNAPSEA